MFKYLLCWRYLRTRYIALASIISVTLGVATLIIVNAVMSGFTTKMRDRLHGVLADLTVECVRTDGFGDWPTVMKIIEEVGGDDVVALAPTVETLGIITITLPDGQKSTREVKLIGIDPEARARCGDFEEHLISQAGDPIAPSFRIPDEILQRTRAAQRLEVLESFDEGDPFDQFLLEEERARLRAPEAEGGAASASDIHHGAILGYTVASMYDPRNGEDFFLAPEGSEVVLTFVEAAREPRPVFGKFTVIGYFKSEMSEYDSRHVYVPIERLQFLRQMGDEAGGYTINQIQITAKAGADLDRLAAKLNRALAQYRPHFFQVSTWEQMQGPLLAAVEIERSILNILLFLIIAVAGFGILAIFFMIVVEKTRDIGILKALGASDHGIRQIFLGYGLLLGLVGSGVGLVGGLLFVEHINWIELQLSALTGRKVFDGEIYYFDEIPTRVEPWTVAAVVLGSLAIAVAASVWPAQRASKLRPVQALRYE